MRQNCSTPVSTAAKQGLTTWLDATPAGATVYGPLGFTPTLELRRLRLRGIGGTCGSAGLLSDGNLDELIARDRRAMGFDRSALLRELGGRSGSQLVSHGSAMALIRDGRTARHIGPLFADDAGSAAALVETIAQSETGPILIDVVSIARRISQEPHRLRLDHRAAVSAHAVRPRGNQTAEPPFAVAGPEYG